jgi:hypothetical protein
MRWSGWVAALALVWTPIPLVLAQVGPDTVSGDQYIPRLVSIMETAQTRHMKLWFAGEAGNWELAAYELRQLKASLAEAAVLYSGIPVSNITTLAGPLQAASDAIDGKDGKRFAKAFGEVTDGCNACHRSMDRSFVIMRTPTAQPFGNQLFSPQKK